MVRTRFDISFLNNHPPSQFNYFETISGNNDIYVDLDTLSIGSPNVIDIEASLGLMYPYVVQYIDHRVCCDDENVVQNQWYKYSDESSSVLMSREKMIMWLYMSEFNLGVFLVSKKTNIITLSSGLTITR